MMLVLHHPQKALATNLQVVPLVPDVETTIAELNGELHVQVRENAEENAPPA